MFQVRRFFTFAMARWKLCASTKFEILPLSTCTLYTVAAKILYLQKYSTDFRNLCPARRCWGWAFEWKVLGAQVLCFAIARWKLCASTIFEILPLSVCTLCQQKSYISKSVQSISEILAWARRCWGWAFGWKVLGAQAFYFCNAKVKTLGIDNIWNFPTFNLYTVPAKILPLQKCSTDFRNLLLGSKIFRVVIWVESFRCAGILFLEWQARWKLCASTTFEILPLSTCSQGQQISYISEDIQTIFEIFASARRCLGRAFAWKVSGAQVFYFSNGKAKTLRIDKIRNSPLSNCTLYSVAAKILYLQKYSTDFRNLCLSSKMLMVDIWVECFRCAGILLLHCQGENFGHRQHLKFSHFQLVHRASKNPISPKVFDRF